MPIYEFACEDCFARAEVRASIADKERGLAPTCPACGSSAMRRLVSAFATTAGGVPQATAGPQAGGGCCGGGCCAR